MSEKKKQPKRWHKTKHVGISSDKEGWIQVRAAIKVDGTVYSKKKLLPPGTTIGDALLKHRELKALLVGRDVAPREMTSLLDYAEVWIEDYAKRNRPRVAEITAAALTDHILPEIGHLMVDQLVRQDIVEMTNTWAAKRKRNGELYARDTLRSWLRITRTFIADACAEYQIAFVPTTRVRLPKMNRSKVREMRTLAPTQVVALLDYFERGQPRRYAEVAMLALGGFRPSEIYALQWDRVCLETRQITICRSVDHGHVDAPKTEREGVDATRVQVLPQRAIDALRAHRMWLMESHHVGLETNLVFPSRTGGHRTPSSMTKQWKQAEAFLRLDRHVSAQVLRRTYNTLMKNLTDMATLHAMIGHTDEQMTELYAHIDYEAKAQAVASFEQLLAEAG